MELIMPIPNPNTDEGKDQFIARCMASDVMNREFPKNEQRAAVCFSKWQKHMELVDDTGFSTEKSPP
jgi:hypothetical protein